MPNRMLRDWTRSEKVKSISVHAERFFTRLIMKVDDYGCLYADTMLLKADLFPFLSDSIREADLLRWMTECQKAGLIVLYENTGKRYLQIIDFGQRLDKARGRFPLPGNESNQRGTIYVIGERNSNVVKIGFSANPHSRLKEVSKMVKKELVLLMQFIGTIDEEQEIHKILRKHCIEKEWFTLTNRITDLFTNCYEDKQTAKELIVVIRSNSYPPEREIEVEIEEKAKPEASHPLQNSNLFRRPVIPTIQQVEERFLSQGGTKEMAEKFFNKHNSVSWYLNSSPITNFNNLVPGFIENWNRNSKNGQPDSAASVKIKLK